MPDLPSDLQLAGIFHGLSDEAAMDQADLGATLRRLFDEGRRAFPDLPLPPDAFVRHLASRSPGKGQLSAVRAADLYLACACATGVRGAAVTFDRAHLVPVGTYLARMRPSPAFVDDVRQALREKLFLGKEGAPPKIAEYDGRGALSSWVRVSALRAAIDLRRRAGQGAEERGRAPGEPATMDPEAGYLKHRYRHAFNDAFRRAVAALGAEQRELLRLHFADGLTLDQLAQRLGVHRATIARRIAAAREAIVDEALRLLRTELGVSDGELASLARMMRSQISLSLPGLLPGG